MASVRMMTLAAACLAGASGAWAQPTTTDSTAPGSAATPAPDRGALRAQTLVRLNGGSASVSLAGAGTTAPDMPEELSLDEAAALALRNNFEVLAAAEKENAADWEVAAAYGQYLPQVQYTRSTGSERSQPASFNDANGNRVLDNQHHRIDKVLTVRQPLVDLAIISDILQRHQNQGAAEAEQQGVRERVALETISAYLRLIQAQLSARFAQTHKENLDKLTERMTARVEGGGASGADLDRIRARATSASSAVIEARSEFEAAQVEFRRLTGSVPTRLKVPDSLLPAVPADVEEAVAKAAARNPDYLQATYQADAALLESRKNYSKLLPNLALELTQSNTYNAGGAAHGSPIDGGPYPWQRERRVMAVMTWKLNGGTDLASGVAYGARAREQTFKAMDVRRRVEESVRVGYNALNAADGRARVLTEAVQASESVAEAFEQQYLAGNRPLFDLLDAYERLYLARLDLVRVVIAEAQAGFQVRRQMGDLVGAILSTENR